MFGVSLGLYSIILLLIAVPTALLVLFANILLRDEEIGPIDFMRDLLASPQSVVESNLGEGEQVLLWTRPSLGAYIVRQGKFSLQTIAVGVLLGIVIVATWPIWPPRPPVLVVFLIFDIHLMVLAYRRLEDFFTIYVLTNQRVMRLSGVVQRDQASIDWPRVVDFSWKQSFAGRLFGFATLRVDSASERASLSELRDIPNRPTINQFVVQQLALNSG
jgi:Bacterial PH domain